MSVHTLLEMVASAAGDRPAVRFDGADLTFAGLLDRAWTVGSRVRDASPGCVALVGETSPLLPQLLYGAAMAGRPFVPLNYRWSDELLQTMVAGLPYPLCFTTVNQRGRLNDVPGVVVVDGDHEEAALPYGAVEEAGDVDSDAAVMLFTSGTTGRPKTVVMRHAHLMAYVVSTVEFLSAGPEERALVSVPPYHIAGVAAVLTSTYAGRTVVQLPRFTPEAWVELGESEAVTHAMVVPTMLARILDVVERTGTKLETLRHLSYGGGPMPRATIERAMHLLPHVDFVNAYGLTETASTVSVLGPDDHAAARGGDDDARRRLASVGRALPGVELEIRRPDGLPCLVGEVGEVWVRGSQVSGEYRGAVGSSGDGWFATRDAGHVDEGGYLFLHDRIDDVIVRGGENISPGEVEEALLEIPDVVDAAVFGVPDDEWGQRVEAAVVLTPDREIAVSDIERAARERLRSMKAPQRIWVVDALPRNELGKLLRRRLPDLTSAASDAHRTDNEQGDRG